MYEDIASNLRIRAKIFEKTYYEDSLLKEAADAIDELAKELEREKAFAACWEEMAQDCKERFQKLLDAFPKWIKANGNPNDNNGQQFLVYIVYPNGSGEVTLGEYWDKCEDQKDFGWGTKGGGVVTHYMPLPKPPKETTNDSR